MKPRPHGFGLGGALPASTAASVEVDLALILSNLELTVEERFRRNAEAIQLLERTRRANFTQAQLKVLEEVERERTRANWAGWLGPLDAL